MDLMRIRGMKVLGGWALASGIIWFGLSSPKPGWTALSDALPVWMLNTEASLGLAGLGVILLLIADRLNLRTCSGSVEEHGDDMSFVDNAFPRSVRKGPERNARSSERRQKSETRQTGKPERVALRPCWPQKETSSWVGGMPKLPEHMDWPVIGTRPATFLAQISLTDLPQTLWQGAGPRTGWLVFWAGDDDTKRCAATVVRHVTGSVTDRVQPEGVTPNWHATMVPDVVEAALGEVGKAPARWYLEQVNGPVLGAVEDMMSETPSYYNDELGEWIWEPTWTDKLRDCLGQVLRQDALRHGVDWPSLRGLASIWRATVLEDIRDFNRHITNEDKGWQRVSAPFKHELQLLKDNPGAEKASFEAVESKLSKARSAYKSKMESTKASLRKAQAALRAAEEIDLEIATLEQDTPFTPELGKAILAKLNDKYPALSRYIHPDTKYFTENYARYLYTLDPDSVPDALFTLFAPLWELQCRETVIFIGRNSDSEDEAEAKARLIDMPPHPLAGLTFGDDSRFYSDVRVSDLTRGDLQHASADVFYG